MAKSCLLEKKCQSKYSPGQVTNEEELRRVVMSTKHLNRRGTNVKVGVFPLGHLSDRGLSTLRASHSCRDDLIVLAKIILSNSPKGKKFVGYCHAKCREIRAIKNKEKSQAYSVLDSATKRSKAHADVYFSDEYETSYQQELRAMLCEIFEFVRKEDLK